jgi:hypothetical protein
MIVRRRWTAREIEALRTHYDSEGADWLAERLGRSRDSVTGRARQLWLTSTRCRWRQAFQRVTRSRTVNARFFDETSPAVAYALGVIWGWGRLKMRTRRVLKLIAPIDRKETLTRTLSLMGSRHQLQNSGERLIVEVGNSHLVETLATKFGHPPSRANRNPPLPLLPFELMPQFARGLLETTGQIDAVTIAWIGTPRAITTLEFIIRDATGVGQAATTEDHGHKRISWTAPEDVGQLNHWLYAGGQVKASQ